jgi:hypothetical protein
MLFRLTKGGYIDFTFQMKGRVAFDVWSTVLWKLRARQSCIELKCHGLGTSARAWVWWFKPYSDPSAETGSNIYVLNDLLSGPNSLEIMLDNDCANFFWAVLIPRTFRAHIVARQIPWRHQRHHACRIHMREWYEYWRVVCAM